MACPTDSWICRASCSPPRIRSVSPAGQGGAVSSARDSSAIRGGVRGQVERLDQLPAGGAVLAPVARPGAALRLAVADRGGRDAAAALADALVDPVPLAGDEPLRGVPDLVEALGQVGAVLGHRAGRADQQVALVGQGHPERVDLAAGGPARGDRLGRHQVDRRAGHPRARGGDPRRAPAGVAGRGVRQIGYGVEAPARPDQRPDAQPDALVLGQLLDVAVAGGHRLVAAVHHPGVGVPGARVEGGLDGGGRRVELGHGPTLGEPTDIRQGSRSSGRMVACTGSVNSRASPTLVVDCST